MVRGYRLDLSLADERRLCLQFLRSALAGHRLINARDAGEDPPLNLPAYPLPAGKTTPTAGAQQKAISATDTGPTLISLFEYWRDGVQGRIPKTVDDVERRIHEMDALTHSKPADQLVKADFIAYRDARIKKGLALTTVEKDLSFIKTVMQYAFDSDKLPSNPAAGIKVPKDQMPSLARDLGSDDLQKLLKSAIYTAGQRPLGGSGDAAPWLPLIAQYNLYAIWRGDNRNPALSAVCELVQRIGNAAV
jgi:hypothetical protein